MFAKLCYGCNIIEFICKMQLFSYINEYDLYGLIVVTLFQEETIKTKFNIEIVDAFNVIVVQLCG